MKIISQITNSSSTSSSESIITDGKLVCSYPQIPAVFAGIGQMLARGGVTNQDCVALGCENSLPTALVLLYLLEHDYSFLLLPKENLLSTENHQDLPKFCRHVLVTKDYTDDGEVDLEIPEQFLHFRENPHWNGVKAEMENPKLYMRTSGSTGKPKKAMHSHANLRENVLNCVERLNLHNDDRVAIPVPIYHMYGLGAALLPSVAVGASIDLQKGANLLRYLQRERQFSPNVAFMTPSFCNTLIKGRRGDRQYKLTVAAGDLIREEVFAGYEARMGCLVKLYGSTEMGAIAAASPKESREIRIKTVGQPMPGVELRISSPTKKYTKGVEAEGELWCYHKCGFEGYVDDEGEKVHLNSEEPDNWFRTKDWGKIWSDGHLEVRGRCDHSINRDGLLVFFSEVERAIATIAGIDSVVVLSKGESKRGKGLVAYCVLAKGAQDISAEDIRSSCFDLLPRRAVPDYVFLISALPMLPNGKVDRQNLIARKDEVKTLKI